MVRYRCTVKFSLLLHLMTLLSLTHNTEEMGALYYFIIFDPSNKAGSFKPLNMRKHIGINNRAMTNQHFTLTLVNYLVITTCISWLLCLLLQAGDVHPNPGPSSTASDSSISSISSESISSYLNITVTYSLSTTTYRAF